MITCPLVEVPAPAFEAVLELLHELLDAGELEGDRCPLCNRSYALAPLEGWSHESDCPIGRARTVREALDYSDPEAQIRALASLDTEVHEEAPPASRQRWAEGGAA